MSSRTPQPSTWLAEVMDVGPVNVCVIMFADAEARGHTASSGNILMYAKASSEQDGDSATLGLTRGVTFSGVLSTAASAGKEV